MADIIHGVVLRIDHERSDHATIQLLKVHLVISHTTIQSVVMDKWSPFRKDIHQVFPTALLTNDKYHVVQKIIQGLDQVYKNIQSVNRYIKMKLLLFLMNGEKLTEKLNACLDELLEHDTDLA